MSRISILAIAGAFALTVSPLAISKTYYVDSLNGNDTWTGESSIPGTKDGPWQSLSRISEASPMPGDSVLLKCGGVWYETLTLKVSGTTENPITVGSYPHTCTNKPLIRGSTPIPEHNWIVDSGHIYKMSTAVDLITSGTFENGLGNWSSWSPQHNATLSLSSNCAVGNGNCLSFTAGSGHSIAISNYFALQGKQAYSANFSIKAPVGATVQVVLRRAAAPWDSLGLNAAVTGNGTWQTYTLPFTSTASLTNARLDFVVPAGHTIGLDNVKIASPLPAVLGVFDDDKTINIAHHPNRGHNALQPDSLFFAVAQNSSTVSLTGGSGIGSSYLTTGTDLEALAHPAITAGTGIRIRPNAWTLNDRKVVSVSGSRLTFDTPTTHPVEKDWGYFLYGQRWMLDQPGEWHYDATTKTVYVWMSDGLAPGNRISIGRGIVGIEARDTNHIRIDGLAIQNVGVGVHMLRANNVILRNMAIRDTLGVGIDALLSTDSGVENSEITGTAADAISARLSVRFNVQDNLITGSGVQTTNGAVTGLPGPATAAITAGDSATIRGNRIHDVAYSGIFALANNIVSENHIENACLVLDDCGAIYTSGSNPSITIENNTVLHVIGGLAGKPANSASQAQGIYLDELSTGVTVRGNTVADADNGIQIHNAASNLIEGNTLYNNRRHQVWLQEQTNHLHPEGDIHNNIVHSNRLFSTKVATLATTAIKHETKLGKDNTHRFASYDNNLYFTFLSPTISSEMWPSGNASYNLPTWQAAMTADGLPRNLDPTSSEVNSASLGYAAYRITGPSILPNGDLAGGKTGWEFWNRTSPYGAIALEPCTVASQCLRYTAGASVSQLSSPKFSVQKDKWYKVSFDFKTGTNAQQVYVVARRGGGGTNGYENLMSSSIGIVGTTAWNRYGFIFQATKSVNVNDPVTLDKGARIDFDGVMPGQNITVANLELVPLSAIDANMRSHILINPGSTNLDVDCPDVEDALLCNEYVRFTDGQAITWPYTVAPHASEVIYSRDSSLTDGDGDGIPDYQDTCPGTPALKAVNAAGCTLGDH